MLEIETIMIKIKMVRVDSSVIWTQIKKGPMITRIYVNRNYVN